MSSTVRTQYQAAFKAKVTLEANWEDKTQARLSSEHGVHPNQISQWKQPLITGMPARFVRPNARVERERRQVEERWYAMRAAGNGTGLVEKKVGLSP